MPLEAQYKALDGRLHIKITAGSIKEIFSEVAALQEIFDDTSCGACGATNTRLLHRKVKDKNSSRVYDYYELACVQSGCRARFSFGESMDKISLFPKRKDDDGNWLPDRGWAKYVRPGNTQDKEKPEPWE